MFMSIEKKNVFRTLLVQILDHVIHAFIMSCLEATQKFATAIYTKYMNFWRVEVTQMT